VHLSPRKKKSFTKPFKTSSPLHRQKRRLLPLPSLKRTGKDLFRVYRLKVKRSQARHRLRRVQVHSHKVLPVNHLIKACPVRSPQWGNSLPAVLITSTKDPPQNRPWRTRSRRPCPVCSGKAHRLLHTTLAHLHTKALHPDRPRTRKRKLRSSKGCNLRQDSSKHHTPAPISLLRLPCHKYKHRDRRLLRRRTLNLLHQRQEPRLKPRLLSLQDPLLRPLIHHRNHLLHRLQVRQLNKFLHLLSRLLHRLKLRLLLNLHLRSRQPRPLPRHRRRHLLLWHSNRRLQSYLQSLRQLQWLLRHQLYRHSFHPLLQLLRRRQHQWHRLLQQTRTHMVG
jgi:hypothetical protein